MKLISQNQIHKIFIQKEKECGNILMTLEDLQKEIVNIFNSNSKNWEVINGVWTEVK